MRRKITAIIILVIILFLCSCVNDVSISKDSESDIIHSQSDNVESSIKIEDLTEYETEIGIDTEDINVTESENETTPIVEDMNLSLMQKVLLNKAEFYGRLTFYDDNPSSWHKVEECVGFCDYSKEGYNSFYIIDLDKDGDDEVCVSYNGHVLIFRKRGGDIYGYNWGFRQFNPPYNDGTFRGSGGASYSTFYGNVSFDNNEFKYEVITSKMWDSNENIHYYKNGEPEGNGSIEISKEEYETIMSSYSQEKAISYDFTIENILKYVD